MKKVRLIIALFVSVQLFVCCTNGERTNTSLVQVDSLLRGGFVDSAYIKLGSVLPSQLRSEADSSYYFLLHAQASYRMYKPADPMKWLDFAIRYYLKIGHDAEKLASAYYYKGMLLYENGDVRNGVLNLKNAEFIAAKSTDTELRHKIFESLSVVNDDAGEFRMAISYAKKSLAESEKSGNVNWLAHAYNNLAVLSSKIGRSDRASYYLKMCTSVLRHVPSKDKKIVLNNVGAYLMHTNATLAKRYFCQILQTSPIDEAYGNLATIYMNEGNYVKADSLLRIALRSADMQIRCEAMWTLFHLQQKRGDTSGALLTAEKLVAQKDSMLKMRNNCNVQAIQLDFDNTKSRQKYERNIAIGGGLILLLLMLAVIIVLYYKYKEAKTKAAISIDQMRIRNYELQIADLQRNGINKEKEIKLLNRRKEALLGKHRDMLNHGYLLYSDVLANKTTVLWRKRDFESVIEYYRLLDADFVDLIDNGYDGLSAKYKFEMILEHINKSNTEIEHIMGVANGSLRSIRSRIKKKKL